MKIASGNHRNKDYAGNCIRVLSTVLPIFLNLGHPRLGLTRLSTGLPGLNADAGFDFPDPLERVDYFVIRK